MAGLKKILLDSETIGNTSPTATMVIRELCVSMMFQHQNETKTCLEQVRANDNNAMFALPSPVCPRVAAVAEEEGDTTFTL